MNPPRLVPGDEIARRVQALQGRLARSGIDLALIRQNADLYYFTGTVQDSHLLVPVEGEPLLLVWRSIDRAREESPIARIVPLPSLNSLAGILAEHGFPMPKRLGLEMDCLPAALYLFYTKKVWAQAEVVDVSPLVRGVRAVKSMWEIDRIRSACQQVAQVFSHVPDLLKPGVSELALSAEIERELRLRGHPGFIRMRGWTQEFGSAQVLSGPEGAVPSWTNTPGGGRGTGPAFGVGACSRRIGVGEPVSVDMGGLLDGYHCDETRLFFLGNPPASLVDSYRAVLRVHRGIQDRLVPGAASGEIYSWAVKEMGRLGYADHFMGILGSQVKFVGHGLGVEIDEYPFLSRRNEMILEPGMVIAVEPKLAFPGVGLVGIEDTFLVTEKGAEMLTQGGQEMCIL